MRKLVAPFALAAAALLFVGCSSDTAPETQEESAPTTEEVGVEEVVEETPDEGTRDNPLPIGTAVTAGDWSVTIDSVNLDATDIIMSENQMNDAPADGNIYIMVTATVTYNGSDPQGEMPMSNIEYVTADGNTVQLAWVGYEETDFTTMDNLYEGASHTGANAYEVPADSAGDGTLAVSPDGFSDNVFVAVK